MRILGAFVSLLALGMFLVVPISSAAAVRRPDFTVTVVAAPGASATFLTAIADDGRAVGAAAYADGTRHALLFDGRHLVDLGPRLGATSAAESISNAGVIVGYASSNPAARLGNLFDPTAPAALIPHAFALFGNRLHVLNVPSVANGVNDLGEVVGAFRRPDGSVHAFLWRPEKQRLGRAGRRFRSFVDLGPGDARSISDPFRARGTRTGRAEATATGNRPRRSFFEEMVLGTDDAIIDSFTGQVISVGSLPSNVGLLGGDNQGDGVGGEDVSGGRSEPVIRHPNGVISASNLTGIFTGASGSGLFITGENQSNLAAPRGFLSVNGRPIDLTTVALFSLPRGAVINSASQPNDDGLVAVEVKTPDGKQEAGVIDRNPFSKRTGLIDEIDEWLNRWGDPYGKREQIARAIKEAVDSWAKNHQRHACSRLKAATTDVADDYFVVEKAVRAETFIDPATYSPAASPVRDSIRLLASEIGCPDPVKF